MPTERPEAPSRVYQVVDLCNSASFRRRILSQVSRCSAPYNFLSPCAESPKHHKGRLAGLRTFHGRHYALMI